MKLTKSLMAILMIIAILITASSAFGEVYINEFVPNSDFEGGDDKLGEWIELYSDTGEGSVLDWTITDGTGTFTLPDKAIPADGHLVLVYEWQSEDPMPDNYVVYGEDAEDLVLADEAPDSLVLSNAAAGLEDSIYYNGVGEISASGEGESLARIHDGAIAGGTVLFNDGWIISDQPTQGELNNRMPTLLQELPEISFQEGVDEETTVSLVLSEYFSTDADAEDGENDVVTYTPNCAVDAVSLTCTIIDGVLEITLNENWDNYNPELTLTVSDTYGEEDFPITVTVESAIEIEEDSVSVVIGDNAEDENISEVIEVSSGEYVSVNFDYTNNIDGVIGYVKVNAVADQLQDPNVDVEGEDFVDYHNDDWALLPGLMTASESFDFYVPYKVEDTFTLTIEVLDEDEQGNEFFDEIVLEFDVTKKGQDAIIDSVSLTDENLSCTRITTLEVELSNIGEYGLIPELLIYNQKATNVVVGGEKIDFTFETQPTLDLNYVHTEKVPADTADNDGDGNPDNTVTLEIPVDASELSGEQTLHVYSVSPFFWNEEESFYIADYDSVEMLIEDSCINETMFDEMFTVFRDEYDSIGGNIGFTDFLIEDKPELYNFALELTYNNEDDEEFIACETNLDPDYFNCEILKNDHGEVGLEINVKEPSLCYTNADDELVCSEVKENHSVTVLPTLEVEEVTIKNNLGDEVTEEGKGLEISPMGTLTAEFKINNYLAEKFHGLNAEFYYTGEEPFNFAESKVSVDQLEGQDETTILTLNAEIPYNVAEGTYDLHLKVSGKYTADNKVKEDVFAFNLDVKPGSDGIEISELAWVDLETNETYCNQQPTLKVNMKNGGAFEEEDVNLVIKDEDGTVLYDWYTAHEKAYFTITAGQMVHPTPEIKIDTKELSVGAHTLTVEVTYNTGTDSATPKTIDFTKKDCIGVAQDALTITEDDSQGLSIDLNEYLVKEDGDVVKYEFTNIPGSNPDVITCKGTVTGKMSCGKPKDVNQELNQGQSNVTNMNVTVYGVDNTANEIVLPITVTGVNDPAEIIKSKFEFVENSYYEIALADVVSDIDNELTTLTFTEDSENIKSIGTTVDGMLKIVPENKDWNTKELPDQIEVFNLTVNDGVNETVKEVQLIVRNDKKDSAKISEKFPAEDTANSLDNENFVMNVTVDNPDGMDVEVEWTVEEVKKVGFGKDFAQYTFNQAEAKEYAVKASLVNKEDDSELDSETWNIKVNDQPLTEGFTTNLGTDLTEGELASFKGLTIENSYGKIAFDDKFEIDLRSIGDFNEIVSITANSIGIDTEKATGFDVPAEITIKGLAQGKTIVYKYPGFGEELGTKNLCTDCTLVSHLNNNYIFEVKGFSTYVVVNEKAAALEVSEILFNDVERAETVETTFTVKNLGTIDSITGLEFDTSNVDSDYSLTVLEAPTTIQPLEETTVKLQLTVPENEDAGEHSVGNLKITSNEDNETVSIKINPRNYLEIKEIEINGKSSGDFVIDEINEITVNVENNYNQDMEEVVVEVTILDVDDEDLEEESDEEDINDGDDQDFEVEFDLAGETLDQEKYTIEVKVTGEAEDGSEHEIVETKEVDLDLEKYNVVIKKATLSSTTLQCLDQTSLKVTVENLGKKKAKDVEIQVTSSNGLSLSEPDITLDDLFDDDNDKTETFILDFNEAVAGTYPITVEAFRDGDLEDSTDLSLEIKECLTTKTATQTQTQQANQDLVAQLQAQLQAQLAAQQQEDDNSAVTSSFTDTGMYTTLLGILVVLLFFAVVLAVAVMVKKSNKK